MAGLLKTYTKTATERRRFYIDFDCWLEPTEKLTEFTIVVQPWTREIPLMAYGAFVDIPDNRKLVTYFGGGIAGVRYRIVILTKTSQGQTKQDEISMKVTA
jgi:hypothetical protein